MDKNNQEIKDINEIDGTSCQAKQDDQKKVKKTIFTVLICIFIAAVVLAVLNSLDYDAILKKWFGNEDVGEIEYNYYFYQPDYDTDIMKDESYLILDRTVAYTEGGITTIDVDLDDYPGCGVIRDYLDSMIMGDAQAYNSLFTEEYYQNEENKPLEQFPPQRLYNIKVILAQDPYVYTEKDYEGKYTGTRRYLFKVEYYIQYNTGTVRNDIPSDASRPIYIEVFENRNGVMKINYMSISIFNP